jgi:hypothetical protein
VFLNVLVQLGKQVLLIGPYLEHLILKIGFEDTIGAVQGAVLSDVNDPVSAAAVESGSRAPAPECSLVVL